MMTCYLLDYPLWIISIYLVINPPPHLLSLTEKTRRLVKVIKCCCLLSVHLWKLVDSSVDGTEVLAFSYDSDADRVSPSTKSSR
jgi:hypothetical protein